MAGTNRVPSPDRPLRAAFRDLHGRRLHGFVLLLTLGDPAVAARLASQALSEGGAHIDEHRHPERAAAWLRRWVVDRARVPRIGPADDRVLLELGADRPVIAGIAALDRRERAAFIASAIERLDRRDVATIVGRDGPGLDRLLRRSRERYMRIHAANATGESVDGPIMTRVRDTARRAMT